MRNGAIWPEIGEVHDIVFDFDGVFTDNKVYVTQDGTESVRCDRGDGLGIDFLHYWRKSGRLKADVFILSKEPNPVVLARARKLKLECRHGIGNKKAYLDAYFSEKYPNDPDPYRGIIYLGNDLNDLPLICSAGFSVVPEDAHPMVKRYASAVLPFSGGNGFLRAFVEEWFKIGQMTLEDIYELVHNC